MERVHVYVRIRDEAKSGKDGISGTSDTTLRLEHCEVSPGVANIAFEKVWKETATQRDIFDGLQSAIQQALQGYRVLVSTMGNESTGKTYSMYGTDRQPGIVQHTLAHIFQQTEEIARSSRKSCFQMECSLMGIQSNVLYDGLIPQRYKDRKLGAKEGIYSLKRDWKVQEVMQRLSSIVVSSPNAAMCCLREGLTRLSDTIESPFHTALTLKISFEDSNQQYAGQIVFLDVTGNAGIGSPSVALHERGKRKHEYGAKQHSFTKDHTLSELYGDAFGGNWKTFVIVTVRRPSCYQQQTIQALLYACKLKEVCNKSLPHVTPKGEAIKSAEPDAFQNAKKCEKVEKPLEVARRIKERRSVPNVHREEIPRTLEQKPVPINRQIKLRPLSPSNQQQHNQVPLESMAMKTTEDKHSTIQEVRKLLIRVFGGQSFLQSMSLPEDDVTIEQLESFLVRFRTHQAYAVETLNTQIELLKEDLQNDAKKITELTLCAQDTSNISSCIKSIYNCAKHVCHEVYDPHDQPHLPTEVKMDNVDSVLRVILDAVNRLCSALNDEISMKENCASKISQLKAELVAEKKTYQARMDEYLKDRKQHVIAMESRNAEIEHWKQNYQDLLSQTSSDGPIVDGVQRQIDDFSARLALALEETKSIIQLRDSEIQRLKQELGQQSRANEKSDHENNHKIQVLEDALQSAKKLAESQQDSLYCAHQRICEKFNHRFPSNAIPSRHQEFSSQLEVILNMLSRYDEQVEADCSKLTEIEDLSRAFQSQQREREQHVASLQAQIASLQHKYQGIQKETSHQMDNSFRMMQEDLQAMSIRHHTQLNRVAQLEQQLLDQEMKEADLISRTQRKARRRYREQIAQHDKEKEAIYQSKLQALQVEMAIRMETTVRHTRDEEWSSMEERIKMQEDRMQIQLKEQGKRHQEEVQKLKQSHAQQLEHEATKLHLQEEELRALRSDIDTYQQQQNDTAMENQIITKLQNKLEQMTESMAIANDNESKAYTQMRIMKEQMQQMEGTLEQHMGNTARKRQETLGLVVATEMAETKVQKLNDQVEQLQLQLSNREHQLETVQEDLKAYHAREAVYEREITQLRQSMENYSKKYIACQNEFRRMSDWHELEIQKDDRPEADGG